MKIYSAPIVSSKHTRDLLHNDGLVISKYMEKSYFEIEFTEICLMRFSAKDFVIKHFIVLHIYKHIWRGSGFKCNIFILMSEYMQGLTTFKGSQIIFRVGVGVGVSRTSVGSITMEAIIK